jgi:hypothetical protein
MKKLVLSFVFCTLLLSCSRESDPEIISDYTGVWNSQEFNYYPHRIIEIRSNGNGSLTIEHNSTVADVISGKVTITDNSILQINIEKMRINNPPAIDTLDNRMWMQVEGVWFKRN